MDNSNQNPMLPNPADGNKVFPSFDQMQKKSHKPQHFIIAVVAILAVGAGLIWYFYSTDNDFIPYQISKKHPVASKEPDPQDEINSVQVNSTDTQFQSVDGEINSL